LRAFVDSVWPIMVQLGATAASPPHDRLSFVRAPAAAVAAAIANVDFVQESGPEREAVKQE
jgi:3-hydroxyacyl-CoA dehydrogenase